MADALLAMGWFIGINGIVTFKNAEALRKVVHSLPLDRLLLETDAPYLTPVPFRGKPNSPAQVPVIAEFLAEDLRIPVAQLAAQTSENARRLFALPA
jgi:TatD DNase family protein